MSKAAAALLEISKVNVYFWSQEFHEMAPPVAKAARKFIVEQLTPEALSCYWLKVSSP